MKDIKLGSTGILETFAVMQVGPPQFPLPYVIGYIKTQEGALVFTQIIGCEAKEESLSIGQTMELVIEQDEKDAKENRSYKWKYKPIEVNGK